MTRILILADTHCGHELGLTPPCEFQHGEIQRIGWNFFKNQIDELKPFDLIICNGDLVDGTGHKDTTGHLTTDVEKQIEMAIKTIEYTDCKKVVFARGTPYHVCNNLESENLIAKHFNAEIQDELKLDVNGCIIHARHTVGKSGTAYGSITSAQRSAVVQILNDIEVDAIKADIFVRSHIHEYNLIDRELMSIVTTPALQFKGTSYGRKCTGFYSYGFCYIDVEDKNNYHIGKRLLSLKGGYADKVIKI